MEVDRDQAEHLLQLQPQVQEVLAELLPFDRRSEVEWQDFVRQPVQCTEDLALTQGRQEKTEDGNTEG